MGLFEFVEVRQNLRMLLMNIQKNIWTVNYVRNYFEKKELVYFYKMEGSSRRAQVQCSAFKVKQIYGLPELAFYRVEILRQKSKMDILILDVDDISRIINPSTSFDNFLDTDLIAHNINAISKRLLSSNSGTYSLLKIPLRLAPHTFDLFNSNLHIARPNHLPCSHLHQALAIPPQI